MTPKESVQRPLHILIPADLHERLKALAEEEDRSIAAETRQAIEQRLRDRDAKAEAPAA